MTLAAATPVQISRRSSPFARQSVERAHVHVLGVLLLLAAHVPLALVMFQQPSIARVHALATIALGVAWAVSRKPLGQLAIVAAYIAGADVLWRMVRAPIFWESGKYAVILIFFLAIQRTRPLRTTNFPVIFFALLVPAALLTIANIEPDRSVRRALAFNLSGPLALAVCVAFFSRVHLSTIQVKRLLVAFLGPSVGVLAVCVFSVARAEEILFKMESNRLFTGGFSPNQVSSALGCGAMVAFLLALLCATRQERILRYLMFLLAVVLAAQSALTFSRSGLYLAVISSCVGAAYMLRDARSRTRVLCGVCFVYVIGAYVVIPRLDAFTENRLSRRFSERHLTGRDRLMLADLDLWWKNPILGAGPGMGYAHRAGFAREAAAAHCELTRLAGEHGLLGIAAIGLLLHAAWRAMQGRASPPLRAVCAAMLAFSLLYMGATAMRLLLPSFTFGLAFASFEHE
ncbi:MAG: hypothetical protein JXB62_06950 [Pirellulales bacterium]|nr:hypothetical protein [Pirellulales bacterium]